MPDPATEAPVVAVLDDLIFATKIQATARAVGAAVRIVKADADLRAALAANSPRLVLLDLNVLVDRIGPVIALAKKAAPAARVVAYVSHVNQDLADAAREAGADEVLPRSRFVQVLADLLSAAAPPKPTQERPT